MNEWFWVIPNSVIKSTDLNSTQKLFICVLSSLSAEKGYVYAWNEYIAERFNLSKVQVSRILWELERKGYTKMEYEREGSKIKSRKIWVLPLTQMLWTVNVNDNGTVNINVKENNINNNNINNNINENEFYEEIYQLYIGDFPKEKKKYVRKQETFRWIEKVRKEYDQEMIRASVKNYKKVTEVMYQISPQYFFCCSKREAAKYSYYFKDFLPGEFTEREEENSGKIEKERLNDLLNYI